jgi:flavin reductase (DIM6/NTAB) family NADH-FMN oxidoreductase RutF
MTAASDYAPCKPPPQSVNQERPVESTDRFIVAMGRLVTGVTVVTTDGPAGRFGITVSAFSSVSADPPLVLACVNRKSPVVAAVLANGVFCINVLADAHRHVADTFAGRNSVGKSYDFDIGVWGAAVTGAPLLGDAAATFDCFLDSWQDAGSHRIFIGKVAYRGLTRCHCAAHHYCAG